MEDNSKGWEQMRLPLLILHVLAGSIGLLTGRGRHGCAQRRQTSPRIIVFGFRNKLIYLFDIQSARG